MPLVVDCSSPDICAPPAASSGVTATITQEPMSACLITVSFRRRRHALAYSGDRRRDQYRTGVRRNPDRRDRRRPPGRCYSLCAHLRSAERWTVLYRPLYCPRLGDEYKAQMVAAVTGRLAHSCQKDRGRFPGVHCRTPRSSTSLEGLRIRCLPVRDWSGVIGTEGRVAGWRRAQQHSRGPAQAKSRA